MTFEVKEEEINSFCVSQKLGDGHVVNNTYLSIVHSYKQLEYLQWKRQIAISLGLKCAEIKERTRFSTFVTEQKICSFGISALGTYLKPIASTSLEQKIQSLNPLGLLLWWLDDGCMVVHKMKNKSKSFSRFGLLGTEAFSFDKNVEISQALLEKFDIVTKVHSATGGIIKDKRYHRQYLPASSMRKFIDTVRPHIEEMPVSMKYKLNMAYVPTRIKSTENYPSLYNFS